MAMEQSLFGPSAATVQDQLLQQDAAFGNNLTPVGLATAIGGSAGRHIGNIMGLEDPRVAEAKNVQEAVQELKDSGIDMSDPAEYFKKMAGIFGAKGLTKQAEMAAAKALEYQTKKEERADRESQRKYKLDEHTLAMEKHYVDLAEARVKLQQALVKASEKPDFDKLQAFIKDAGKDASISSIVAAVDEFNTPTGTLVSAIKKLQDKEKGKFSAPYEVNVNGKIVRVQKDLQTEREHPVAGNEASIVNKVDARNYQESEFDKRVGAQGGDAITAQFARKQTAMAELSDLEALRPVISNMRSGLGADVLQYADQFAAQFGGGGSQLREAVNNRAQFNKIVGQMLLSRIKKLGANPSNSDRDFVEKILPNAKDPKEALSAAINYYSKVANEEIQDADALAKQINANKGLINKAGELASGRRSRLQPTAKTPTEMTDAELEAAIAARRAGK